MSDDNITDAQAGAGDGSAGSAEPSAGVPPLVVFAIALVVGTAAAIGATFLAARVVVGTTLTKAIHEFTLNAGAAGGILGSALVAWLACRSTGTGRRLAIALVGALLVAAATGLAYAAWLGNQ